MPLNPQMRGKASLPMVPKEIPQLVPSKHCLSCDVCCRFPEHDSFLRPYFTREEITAAVKRGISPAYFSDHEGCQIAVVPHRDGEGYLCPAFDSDTSECLIYEARPLDCQIYPFTLMWNVDHTAVMLGWDQKCPFMMTEASVGVKEVRLIPEAEAFAARVHDRFEHDPQMVQLVIQHPHLVTPFQEDVVVVTQLESLTQHFSTQRSSR